MPIHTGVVLGTLYHTDALIAALEALNNLGFQLQSYCIAGTREAMAQVASEMQSLSGLKNHLHSLVLNNEPLFTHDHSPAIYGSCGALVASLRAGYYQSRAFKSLRNIHAPTDIYQRLESIDQHCVNLIVGTDTYTAITSAAKVMLQYSALSVHTHEFKKINRCTKPVSLKRCLPGV